jgi:hypothetical protein
MEKRRNGARQIDQHLLLNIWSFNLFQRLFDSEFYCWIDAGICIYRDIMPTSKKFPNINKLIKLPKDKLLFSSSDCETFMPHMANNFYYYHYISGTYMLHKSFIDTFLGIYKSYLDFYLPKKDWKNTDQVILTYIYAQTPELFFKLAHGYGAILPLLE